jgi:uncharacterized protein
MHLTLHLTDACNLACRYCYVRQGSTTMSRETAHAAVDLAARLGSHSGIIFFGGEPLLCRDLIEDTVAYGDVLQAQADKRFYYKITTNGLLLDDAFLRYAQAHQIFIALSHDGVQAAQDTNRVTKTGAGCFAELEHAASRLLRVQPYAPALLTIAPNSVSHYAEGVAHLRELGFRYLICSLDYSGSWDNRALAELRRQYRKLADLYRTWTLREDKFYFSPFEVKLASHIHGDHYCRERCELGKNQVSVAPDGQIYPCVQFVGDERYAIGDVRKGIDDEKRLRLYQLNELEKESCRDCAVKQRCNHQCACLNKQATGDYRQVSPTQCAHERMLFPIVDQLAESLYKKRAAIFIQKQYNDMYPLLSLVEDQTVPARAAHGDGPVQSKGDPINDL